MLRRISTPLDIYYFRIGINNTVKFYLLLYFVESELPGVRSEILVKVNVKVGIIRYFIVWFAVCTNNVFSKK